MENIKDYLNTMEEPEKSLALKNTHPNIALSHCSSVHFAIGGAFLWNQTDEGTEYWQIISNKYSLKTNTSSTPHDH